MALKKNAVGGVLPTAVVNTGNKLPTAGKAASSGGSKKSYGGYGGGGGGGAGGGGDKTADFQDLLTQLYQTSFASAPIAYEQASEEQLGDQISAWLRPSYDQAIYNRSLSTARANAELDADAIARGMGASSYVTDVKSRNFRDEAKDIALLESEYGATLAKNVSQRLEEERQRALEVAMFNKEQEQGDYQMAYDAAMLLLQMGAKPGTADQSASRRLSGTAAAASPAQASGESGVTSAGNCATFLARLSPAQRAGIYNGSDAQSMAYRNEIIASVGLAGFFALQNRYLAG